MPPITPSHQSQNRAAAANIINPEADQQPSAAFTRSVSEAYGNVSASTSTVERAADGVDTPPNTGLVDRTITETQTLSVQSKPLTDASQLPVGHTYQPYFWLSKRAHQLLFPPLTEPRADMQSQVIRQLLMSERAAMQEFQERFEYRFVDYGYTSVDTSGMPEKNYGVFAKRPVAKGTLLGIYSGIGYSLKFTACEFEDHLDGFTDYLHRKSTEELPDFMSYYRTVMAGLRGKEQTQRTVAKYSKRVTQIYCSNPISIVPENERYTPMHFVNSANRPEDANTDFDFIMVNTGSGNFYIPICVATKDIAAGQELLASYYANPNPEVRWDMTLNAAEEKAHFNDILNDHLDIINKLNLAVPSSPPISPYVAAPVICVSETIRENFRGKLQNNTNPRV